jgi:hypothetical protein
METYLLDCTLWSLVGFTLGAVSGYMARKKREHDHA